MPHQLTRGECLALARQGCTSCLGLGVRQSRASRLTVCSCVYRAIFRVCYARFKRCAWHEGHVTVVSFDRNPGPRRQGIWGIKSAEFVADFLLVARRALSAAQHKLFRYHFLLGADWRICLAKLAIERGNFFHEVYRIQQKLGRTCAEIEPYALFPLDEYFGSYRANGPVHPILLVEPPSEDQVQIALRFPLAQPLNGAA